MNPWLVVGLGNPGAKYLNTRHNIGFMCLDQFSAGIGNPRAREEHKALVQRFKMEDRDIIFAKPQTFMNLSGESVRPLMDFYKVPLELVVVHDEVDIPFGAIKIQRDRSAGGHNGLKSIHQVLGTQDYMRLRLGVGRSPIPQIDTATHVLQNFNDEEAAKLPEFLNRAGDALETLVLEGMQIAATRFSRSKLE